MTSNPLSLSYFEKIVQKPTWKEILLDLIATNKIDPWNLDIKVLSDAFTNHIKKMEKLDFALEANVILAAAILLKYKSEYLRSFAYPPEPTQDTLMDYLPPEEFGTIPQLTIAARIPPRRPITLPELLAEMEKVIKYDQSDRIHIPKGSIDETIDFVIDQKNIEGEIDQIYQRIGQVKDSENLVVFSQLTKDLQPFEVVYSLLCLLYLVQQEKIELTQDQMFGEIFIRYFDAKDKSERKIETLVETPIVADESDSSGESTGEEELKED
ncbi:hypothetical protein HY990_05960 [Candidatus Micrarchaeota archaeon]|nr:hypothetical protein [Candidatus Micrarchaeota archaeon]